MQRYGKVIKRKRRGSYGPRKRTTNRRIRSAIYDAMETKREIETSGNWDTIGAIQGTLVSLVKPQRGFLDNQRIGNKIDVLRINFRLIVGDTDASFTPASSLACRLLIVQSRGGELTTSDMPNLYTPPDYDKYFVHYDRYIAPAEFGVQATSGGAASKHPMQKVINYSFKPCWKRLTYNDGDTNPAKPIYFHLISDSGSMELRFSSVCWYKDG